jgi:hypothetical protein
MSALLYRDNVISFPERDFYYARMTRTIRGWSRGVWLESKQPAERGLLLRARILWIPLQRLRMRLPLVFGARGRSLAK